MSWSKRRSTCRLLCLVEAVPAAAGQGTQSATMSGMCSYARDALVLQTISRYVLRAVVDSMQDRDLRDSAEGALDWGEQWAAYRKKHDWDAAHRCTYGDTPWVRSV